MLDVKPYLNAVGRNAVVALKNAVTPVSATGKTKKSIRYEVKANETEARLIIYGRKFFEALETGRGKRKAGIESTPPLTERLLEWMKAKGIGNDLTDKKRQQLARFFALKINREGDSVFKRGGREVYSKVLEQVVKELRSELSKQYRDYVIKEIRKAVR